MEVLKMSILIACGAVVGVCVGLSVVYLCTVAVNALIDALNCFIRWVKRG